LACGMGLSGVTASSVDGEGFGAPGCYLNSDVADAPEELRGWTQLRREEPRSLMKTEVK